jgi:PII-like signaling protein
MQIPERASLLRIFIGEDDKADGKPLYEAIVLKARETRLAGATVLRGPLGFGRSSMLHTAKVLRLSQDLPIVVEIVDTEEKINAFLPILTELTKSCLITLEKVTVIRYGEDETGLIPERDSTRPEMDCEIRRKTIGEHSNMFSREAGDMAANDRSIEMGLGR